MVSELRSFFLSVVLCFVQLTEAMELSRLQETTIVQDFLLGPRVRAESSFFNLFDELKVRIADYAFRNSAVYYWLISIHIQETTRELTEPGHFFLEGDSPAICDESDSSILMLETNQKIGRLFDGATGTYIRKFKQTAGAGCFFQIAAFDSTGSKVATFCQSDAGPRIWNVHTGRVISNCGGDRQMIESLTFDGTGEHVYAFGRAFGLRKWRVNNGRLMSALPTAGQPRLSDPPIMSKDRTRMIAPSNTEAIIWDMIPLLPSVRLLGHTDEVISAHFDDAETRVVTGCADGTVKIWDVRTGVCLHTLAGHKSGVYSAIFNGPGTRILTTSCDGTIKLWNSHTAELVASLNACGQDYQYEIPALFNKTGSLIITFDGADAQLWDAHSGTLIHTFVEVNSATFNSAGTKIITTSTQAASKLYDLSVLTDFNPGSLTLEQIVLLYLLYETHIINKIKTARKKSACDVLDFFDDTYGEMPDYMRSFLGDIQRDSRSLFQFVNWENLIFNLGDYPHLQSIFDSFPPWIKQALTQQYVKFLSTYTQFQRLDSR